MAIRIDTNERIDTGYKPSQTNVSPKIPKPDLNVPVVSPDIRPINVSGGNVSVPNTGPSTGVQGYASESSYWEEQRRIAAEQERARRIAEQDEAKHREADQKIRDDEIERQREARRVGTVMRPGFGMEVVVPQAVSASDAAANMSGLNVPFVDDSQVGDSARPAAGDVLEQGRYQMPFNQVSVGEPAPYSEEEIEEYKRDTKQRQESNKRREATTAAEDVRQKTDDAAMEDRAAKRVPTMVPPQGGAGEGKPNSFRTLLHNTFSGMTSNMRSLLSNARSPQQKGRIADKFSNDFKERMVGNGFYAQFTQNRNVKLHQIGVGWREVVDLVEQAPEQFESFLRESGCEFDTIVPSDLGEPVDIEKILRIVNYAENPVWVAVSKSPEVDIASVERMQLVILGDQERGLAVHPIIAPLFNADFDGDKAFVYLNKDRADEARSTMEYIVSWEGRTNVSPDWVPFVGLANGTDARKFIRENIFGEWNDDNHYINGIVDAMKEVLDGEFEDEDKRISAWVKLFRMARDMAGDNDILMSNVIQAAYDFSRDRMWDSLLQRSGTLISPDEIPAPQTDEDRLLFDVVEQLVEGRVPNNFQSFRTMFSSFAGNIQGKNPPFRFTGHIGRSFAIDDRIRIRSDERLMNSDGDYEVVTDEDWRTFHHLVSSYVMSKKMALERKKDERWQESRDEFRMRVVRRICKLIDPNMNLYAKDVNLSRGFPGSNGVTFEFAEVFTRAYNIEVELANQSAAKFTDDFQHVEWDKQELIEVDRNGRPINLDVLSEPLLKVYPSISVDKLFPALEYLGSDPRWEGNPSHMDVSGLHSYENESGEERSQRSVMRWLSLRYKGMSALQFSKNNRVIWSSKVTREKTTKKYSDVARGGDVSELQYGIMLSMADKKTSAASTFNKAFAGSYSPKSKLLEHEYDATSKGNRHAGARVGDYSKNSIEEFSDLLCELVVLDDKKYADRSIEITKIVHVVSELFPDMAHYFDFDTVEGFNESGYARVLMGHAREAMSSRILSVKKRLTDRVASTVVSMWFDFYMSSVFEKSSILEGANVDGTAVEVANATNALQFAWNKLASKSETWHGIVKEIQSGGEGWKELHRIAVENRERRGEDGFHPRSLLYAEYWEKHESGSIVDVIHDTNLLYGEKIDIIADIVRWQENDPWLNGFEIPYQMRISDDQLYSLDSANRKSALGDITNFSDAYSSYSKISRYRLHEDVNEARKIYDRDSTRGRLLTTIRNLNKMPWLARSLSDDHYSSVFIPILDKTTHQQEKGSQAAESNFAYESMSVRHLDGPQSDLAQTDDRVLGITNIENVGLSDFLRIFSDQDEMMVVRNRVGALAYVNAASVLYGDPNRKMTEEEMDKELWKFLADNPRVATMLRLHEMCSSPDGGAWVGVSKNGSMKNAISELGDSRAGITRYNQIDHAEYVTEIHPGLASLLVLCDPIGNRTSREYPRSTEKTKKHLLYRMCVEAYNFRHGTIDVNDAAARILEEFGVTEESLIEANRSKYSEGLDDLGLLDDSDRALGEEAANEAIDIYGFALGFATKYITEIANEVNPSSIPSIKGYEAPADIGDRRPDRESIAAFVDINQELSASKTAVSTGVNGMTTFDHVEWVRFIDAQDKYVDLEWVMACSETDIGYPLGFNGSMTSVVDRDGNFVPFEANVDENGEVVTNYDTLVELSGGTEIVVAGNGAQLRDKSTRKDGRVMPALFKQMDSKRSKASEQLNLKLKKYGLDALDSIIKLSSKHRTDINYLQIVQALNQIYEARDNDMMAVNLALAYELYDAAKAIGYNDLSLSDFTCIASLMTIVGENGRVYVRSIEQLSSAIKYQVSRLDHKPSPNEMRDIVNRIVSDNSISRGIGIMTFDAGEAFDSWNPAKVAYSALPTRHVSSNKTRNREMLDAIESDQWDSTQPGFTQKDADKIGHEILKKKTAKKQADKRPVVGVPLLKSVYDRCSKSGGMVKDCTPIAGVGAKSTLKATDRNEPYRNVPKNAIGPRFAYIVGDGPVSQAEFDRAVTECYLRGMTMIVSGKHINRVNNCKQIGSSKNVIMPLDNSGLAPDSIEASPDGDVMIPFFDMRLNGAEAFPIDGNGATFTVASYDEYMTCYESKDKSQGDSWVKIFWHLANRIHLVDEGELSVSGDKLFPNVYHNDVYRRYTKTIREATPDEVEEMIINSSNPLPSIDIGVAASNSSESRGHARAVAWAIERYRDRWILLGGQVTDTMSTDLRPGDIVSWQICEIQNDETGDTEYVFAPIIPFPLHGSVGVPPAYSITNVIYDGSRMSGAGSEGGVISVSWKNETPANGNTVKSINPMSGAVKGIGYIPTSDYADPDDDNAVLDTGTMIDMCMAEEATSSRKEGTDKRMRTLITLMIELRKVGYNFAAVDGSFPGRPDIARRVGIGSYDKEVIETEDGQAEAQTGRITKTEWRALLEDPEFKFSDDRKIEKFLRVESAKCLDAGRNPSDFMANLLDDGDGPRNSGVMWEFETSLEPRLDYEDALLHFFHTINSKFCPDGIDDMSEDHYFRLWRDASGNAGGYDMGQLQMQVPVKDSSGNWYRLWHNVYTGRGFFAKQTTMLERPNVRTAKFNPSAAHAMSYTNFGLSFNKSQEAKLLDWALSDLRANWSTNASKKEASENVEENDSTNRTQTDTSYIDPDTVESMTGDSQDSEDIFSTLSKFRGKTSGIASSILDAAYQAYGKQASRQTETVARQEADQDAIDDARSAFVGGTMSDLTQEDIDEYLADAESMQEMLEFARQNDLDPDVDEDSEAIARHVRVKALLKKYGSMTSTGEPMFMFDPDTYDFSSARQVTPDMLAIIRGDDYDAKMALIFELEKDKAERGGYLDRFLAGFSRNEEVVDATSLEDQIDDKVNDRDAYLAEYLKSVNAKATVDDVRKTENDARLVRKNLDAARRSYLKGAKIKNLELPAYRYTAAYQRVAFNLSNMVDDIENAIEMGGYTITNNEGNEVEVGYLTLMRLYESLDMRVRAAIGETKSDSYSTEMRDLRKIRDRVKKGSIPANSDARKELVDAIGQIEAELRKIDDVKRKAEKILSRRELASLDKTARAQASSRLLEERQNRQQKAVEMQEGWGRIRKSEDPTKAVLNRIAKLTDERVLRAQHKLHQFLLDDGGNEREKELARVGLRFIETLENPTKILTSGFHGETRTKTAFSKVDGKSKARQVVEARPSWGDEVESLLERAQEYIGTGGGALRALKVAMYRMSLGISPDGTVANVDAEDFRISDRQMIEVLKDIIAYCQNGMLPTDLSDSVRGDPRASRDDSGKFVVIGGVKRYPMFMSWDLWYEICADPTSKFYAKGKSSSKAADEYFNRAIESWRQNVHNEVVREGDLDQVVAIDNLARAVLSMGGTVSDISLPDIQTAFDLAAIESDAVRSNDPDIYIPLQHMMEQQREGAERELRRQKHRIETDNRGKQFLRATNSIRRTSGSMRASIMASSYAEEGENLFRANAANAIVSAVERGGRREDSRYDYNNDEYKKVTTSRKFSEGFQVWYALMRIGDQDLLDLFLSEEGEDGRHKNTFDKTSLHSFLVRNGYIRRDSETDVDKVGKVKGSVNKAKNVTAAAASMAERLMTDFAVSEDLPGFSIMEARTFAKVYMTDARTLDEDLKKRTERGNVGEYAYAVDVDDAILTAQGLGASELVRKMASTSTGREAFATMGFFGAGRKNPVTHIMRRMMWDSSVTETLVSTCLNKYPCYGFGKKLTQIPLSSTVSYLVTCGYSGLGDLLALSGESGKLGTGRVAYVATRAGGAMSRAADYQMGTRSATMTVDENGQVRQRRISWVGVKKNLIYDLVMAGSTLGKIIVTAQIMNHLGLTPPEDPDNRLLYEEWRIGGEDGIPLKLAWWMDDLTGVSIPVALGWLVNEGGPWEFTDENGNVVATYDGSELAPSIIINGIASINDGTSVYEAIDLFTHWDEHWKKALGMDALEKIGNTEGYLAPVNSDEWAIMTVRNFLFDQFGQMTPAIINEIVPSSRDWMFAGDRLETTPTLLWSTLDGKVTLDEAKEKGYTTNVDDWSELTLRQITRKYWVLGKLMDIAMKPQTGYTWGEMPESERMDKASYAKWSEFSFDSSNLPMNDADADYYLWEHGKAVYNHIIANYDNINELTMDGFYLSYDALANARSYCQALQSQLKVSKEEALSSIYGIGGSYNEIKAKIVAESDRQYREIQKVSDMLWSSDFPTSVPKYNQQVSDYVTRWVDAEGNPSNKLEYWRGNATEERIPYGNVPNPFTPFTRQRQVNKGWNNESLPWNITGNEDIDRLTARDMYTDLVENGLTYEHKDGTIEDLGKTYFGGTSSPEGLMLGPDNLPTTGSRIDVAKKSSIPSFFRTKEGIENYYKKATGTEYGTYYEGEASQPTSVGADSQSTSTDGNTITGNAGLDSILSSYGIDGKTASNGGYGSSSSRGRYSYGGWRYSYGGGGGGSYSAYSPRIYSTARQVSGDRAAGMSTRQPYKATTTYLRPSFYTSGSRKSYLRMD